MILGGAGLIRERAPVWAARTIPLTVLSARPRRRTSDTKDECDQYTPAPSVSITNC
jgi:hypothetical protein